MQSLLDWLVTVPLGVLYTVLLLTAAIENIFPPFPADVVVAFGSFIVAQAPRGTMLGVFLTVWVGNVSGAMLVYALGRRFGAEHLERRLAGRSAESRDARVRKLFDRYGLPALFVTRFVPGVRAIVPVFAGALKLPVAGVALMIGTASAIWYGAIAVVAYRVGSDWESLRDTVSQYGTVAAIVGGGLLAIGFVAWLIANKRSKAT